MNMSTSTTTIFFSAYLLSDFFGKLIFIGLFILSLITWFVLIQKLFQFLRINKTAIELQNAINVQKGSILNINIDSQRNGIKTNPFAKIYSSLKEKTIEVLDKNHFFNKRSTLSNDTSVFLSNSDIELISYHIDNIITIERKKLEKNLFILPMMVSLAPFVGLLGTVWGILISLSELQKGAAANSNSLVLNGISTALVTTVIGLVIAIPALIAHNYLKNLLQNFISDMCNFSNLLVSTIELQYRKVEVTI